MARTNPTKRLTAAERAMTPEDRAIFDGMPQSTETSYRFADRTDASTATKRLREGGGFVESVARDVVKVRS